MLTPRGTPYAVLRRLAMSGTPPTLLDCEHAERQARLQHALQCREFARLELLIARAMWSAYRNRYTS